MKKLGDYLIEEDVCTKEDIQRALEQQALLRKEQVFNLLARFSLTVLG